MSVILISNTYIINNRRQETHWLKYIMVKYIKLLLNKIDNSCALNRKNCIMCMLPALIKTVQNSGISFTIPNNVNF